MAKDGLLHMNADSIMVLPPGCFLIRNICMVFDRYLVSRESQRFSRAI
jgi:oxygen-independent coproporphyrinogen-3 oxidase